MWCGKATCSSTWNRSEREDASPDRAGGCFRTAGGAELPENRANVELHGVIADPQLQGDGLVREPGRDEAKDLNLARGERGGVEYRELLVRPELTEEVRHHGGVEDDEASEDSADGGRDLGSARLLEEHRAWHITAREEAVKLAGGGDKEHRWHGRQVNFTGRRAIEVDDEYVGGAIPRRVLDDKEAGFEGEHGAETHPGRWVG